MIFQNHLPSIVSKRRKNSRTVRRFIIQFQNKIVCPISHLREVAVVVFGCTVQLTDRHRNTPAQKQFFRGDNMFMCAENTSFRRFYKTLFITGTCHFITFIVQFPEYTNPVSNCHQDPHRFQNIPAQCVNS